MTLVWRLIANDLRLIKRDPSWFIIMIPYAFGVDRVRITAERRADTQARQTRSTPKALRIMMMNHDGSRLNQTQVVRNYRQTSVHWRLRSLTLSAAGPAPMSDSTTVSRLGLTSSTLRSSPALETERLGYRAEIRPLGYRS